jgi:putative transposase
MIRTLHEGLLTDGFSVPLTKLCAWFDVPRRTVYYKPVKAMIEENPSFGYRTVAWLLGFNSEPRSAPPVRAPRRTLCSGSSS